MPSARSQRRVSRAISLTTPTPSSIGLAATCRWIASASLPSTWPSAQAESTISSTTRRAWRGSKRLCTRSLCPWTDPPVHPPHTPEGTPSNGVPQSVAEWLCGLLPSLDASFDDPRHDHEHHEQDNPDDDLDPADVLRHRVRGAEGVAERDDDCDLDDRYAAVERGE